MKNNENKLYKIEYLWNCEDEKMWLKVLDGYWENFTFDQMKLERRINDLQFRMIKALSVEEFYKFLYDEFFVWKYTAKNRLATTRMNLQKYVKENRMNELEKIKNDIFQLDFSDVSESVATVMKIRGLGSSGASAFLAVLCPEKFGTVDQFVVKSLLKINGLEQHNLLKEMNPDNLKTKDIVAVTGIMRLKAAELNNRFDTDFWTPRKIDMILWSIGR